MNPTASVRYSFEDTWILLRGQGTSTRGGQRFAQFVGHADTIVAMPQYRGELFSFGDGKIMKIHRRAEGQGVLVARMSNFKPAPNALHHIQVAQVPMRHKSAQRIWGSEEYR